MRFEWDLRKSQLNRSKHGVSFELAEEVFQDPFAFGVPDRIVDGEERWLTFGSLSNGEILAVAHTTRDTDGEETIRIISARRATPHERKRFEEGY
ncbi:MAG TPA: BrnT family toxin [Thermomicrobiales bacterium]|nr:BrnT family toxin [Thermomicrobiales bacterium]